MDKVDNCVTQENLERIGRMTLFNDILFRNVARLFVRLFTGRESLDVVARDTQYSVVPVTGQRGVVMDLHVIDGEGSVFDFEIQDYRELHLALRARWYHSQLDWEHGPESGQEYDRLPQVQVVFIMRYDPFGQGRTGEAAVQGEEGGRTGPGLRRREPHGLHEREGGGRQRPWTSGARSCADEGRGHVL